MRSLLAVLGAVLVVGCRPEARSVALSFDDLPGPAGEQAAELVAQNDAILASLARRAAPATGFAIAARVQALEGGAALLRRWLERGHELGSHTFSHGDLNEQSAEEFAADVLRAEAVLLPLLAERPAAPLYLRFPYNHTGESPAKRAQVAEILAGRGYRVAVCTIENSDFIFARAYARARQAADARVLAPLREAYLQHTARMIDYYGELHRELFGRETAHVMLLHVSRLNADVLDALLALFEQRGFSFVSLREAQSDPAYRTPEGAATRFGPMWAYRWARGLDRPVRGEREPEPPAWVSEYAPPPLPPTAPPP